MTPIDQLRQHIALGLETSLAQGRQATHHLRLPDGCGLMTLHVGEANALACEVLELRFQPGENLSFGQLAAVAEELCRRITYLMEPLTVVESDPHSEQIQLRSAAPLVIDGQRAYYELGLSTQHGIQLQRFAAPVRASRKATPANLTREVLARLVADLADVCQQQTAPAA